MDETNASLGRTKQRTFFAFISFLSLFAPIHSLSGGSHDVFSYFLILDTLCLQISPIFLFCLFVCLFVCLLVSSIYMWQRYVDPPYHGSFLCPLHLSFTSICLLSFLLCSAPLLISHFFLLFILFTSISSNLSFLLSIDFIIVA